LQFSCHLFWLWNTFSQFWVWYCCVGEALLLTYHIIEEQVIQNIAGIGLEKVVETL